MKKNNRISIVIPTYNRKESLINLLNSLAGKISKEDEVIIVEQKNNNSKDFKKIAKNLSVKMKYCFLENPNTPSARNLGIKKAAGKYIVFFDDDVLVKTKIEAYIEKFKNPMVAAVCGRVITPGQKDEPENNRTGRITLIGNFTDGFSSMIPQSIDTVIGCNNCWRRDVLIEIKGFDSNFSGNAMREESDISLRAKKKGYKILFSPDVVVEHVRAKAGGARKTEGRIRWYFDFFSNETYFFLKHKIKILLPLYLFLRINWAVRCMFGFGREVSVNSVLTPLLGVVDGITKYRRYKNDNWS